MLNVDKTYKLLIGGAFVRSESGRTYKVGEKNVPLGSRKDLRDAIRVARVAQSGWASKTDFNRGQILYRTAEMLDARQDEFRFLPGMNGKEVNESVDALVYYAGWCHKIAQVAGTVNPVNGAYFNFTFPEPMGVVGIVTAKNSSLTEVVKQIAVAVAGGNTVVVLLPENDPIPSLTMAEIYNTSDYHAGVINLISGKTQEMLAHLGAHMDVNAIDTTGCLAGQEAELEMFAAGNVKRIVRNQTKNTPFSIINLMEMKTVWHPVGN